ncbi:MAG TPA: hypothetical protein VNT60_08025, partial [Deinococcales bacterium]|nr:hypothetical protein [Deinococcales bacterium]
PVVGASAGYWGGNFGASLGFSHPLEGAPALPGQRLRPALLARAWWEPRWEWIPDLARGLRVELTAVRSPLTQGGDFTRVLVGLTFALGPFSFSEDVTPSQPDVVFTAEHAFSCSR